MPGGRTGAEAGDCPHNPKAVGPRAWTRELKTPALPLTCCSTFTNSSPSLGLGLVLGKPRGWIK